MLITQKHRSKQCWLHNNKGEDESVVELGQVRMESLTSTETQTNVGYSMYILYQMYRVEK